jgi:cell division protein ZapA
MPELTITIGGRAFPVACQEGEEHFLRTAAAMLDAEAQPLIAQMGRLPEAKMLLMAGLAELEARPETRVEVPVIPPQVEETLAEIAARAEALAARLDDKRMAV